jgi:hypothetical protein
MYHLTAYVVALNPIIIYRLLVVFTGTPRHSIEKQLES